MPVGSQTPGLLSSDMRTKHNHPEGFFLLNLSFSPVGNTQSLQAETGGSHQLADSLQQLHTPAEENIKGPEAQPATVTGGLKGGGGRDGLFLLPKQQKGLDFQQFNMWSTSWWQFCFI